MNWQELVDKAQEAACTDEHRSRLAIEIKEINKQGANDYWMDLLDSGQKFEENKNGLVIPFLLGITDIDPTKGEEKILIYDPKGDFHSEGVKIGLENGKYIFISKYTKIKTKDGVKFAHELSVGDEITC